MAKIKLRIYLTSPAVGGTPLNYLRCLFLHFGQRMPFRFWLKPPLVVLVSLFFWPGAWLERIRLRRKLKRTQVCEEPVFILGHWRSGTTHLHNLLARDSQSVYVTTRQCLFPESFLTNGLVMKFLNRFMPRTRPMDNVRIHPHSPQEDELGMANLDPHSFYNAWLFPKRLWVDYQRYVRFEGVTDRRKRRWQRKYLEMMKKVHLDQGDGRIVSKNPAHTARIAELLGLFPKAKFIFIYRHPTTTFFSTRKLYAAGMPQMAVQSLSQEESDEAIFQVYEDLMQTYFATRSLIPEGNLVEVCYEELEKDRLGALEEIYKKLRLTGWEEAAPKVAAYLDEISGFRKNKHQFPEAECQRVYERWKFAYEKLGYGPQPGS